MNPQMLSFALQALNALPSLITAGKNVLGVVQQTNEALGRMQAEKRDPTPEEWEALNRTIADLRGALHST